MITNNVYQIIKKFKQKGHSKTDMVRKLRLDPKTVAKYYHMKDDEYVAYVQGLKYRDKVYEPYKADILEVYQINGNQKLIKSAVYDYLEEQHDNLPGTEKTLRNYIDYLIETGELQLTGKKREYSPVPELPYGRQLQIDFGEYKTRSGLKLYIFAGVLSASRFKYASLQTRPFTTLDLIHHLLQCFIYIGGRPLEIVIDQDRTMVVSENRGDIIYTRDFLYFIEEMDLRMYVCRKNDPETKGKVENLVKFIKQNFLSIRDFSTLEEAQESLAKWLKRRANGKISSATKCIPSNIIKEEQNYLRELRASIYQKESLIDREKRCVDDKSRISVNASQYSVPSAYRNKTVTIYIAGTALFIFDPMTGEQIEEHTLSVFPGKTIIKRDSAAVQKEKPRQLKEKLLNLFDMPQWEDFVEKNYKKFIRYFRDQYREAMSRFDADIDNAILTNALNLCLEHKTYSIANLYDAYQYYQSLESGNLTEDVFKQIKPQLKHIARHKQEIRVAKRPLSAYRSLTNLLLAVIL